MGLVILKVPEGFPRHARGRHATSVLTKMERGATQSLLVGTTNARTYLHCLRVGESRIIKQNRVHAGSLWGRSGVKTNATGKGTQKHVVAVPDAQGGSPLVSRPQEFPWVVVVVTVGITVSSIASAITAAILYLRPTLQAAEKAALSTDAAAQDMQTAAIEMEKTAIMFQQDVPITMQELQKASEEWELVGKQLNVAVTSVTRPLKPVEKPVEKAAEWVGDVAERSTATISKRFVSETTSVANNLWASVNRVGQQLGLGGLSKEAFEEAKRLVYIGRQQQEARTWIDRWRRRSALEKARKELHSEREREAVRPSDELGYSLKHVAQQEQEKLDPPRYSTVLQQVEENDDPVTEVFTALARAQLAAEEAAASSTALEMAIERAEQSGVLSSSDEEDLE